MKTLTFLILCSLGTLWAAEPQTPPYPLTTCVVSGKKLGSMGEPFVYHYKGQEVRFCCEHCLPKFEKDPASFLKKITDARK